MDLALTNVIAAWSTYFGTFAWILVAALLIGLTCAWVGSFLIMRRMSLMGDAISHSLLPGIVVVFLLMGNRDTGAMLIGALVSGLVAALIIEFIQRRSPLKQDSAIAVAFTTLFALGLVLVNLFASQVDLDADCVLFGELAYVPLDPRVLFAGLSLPESIWRLGLAFVLSALVLWAYYKEWVLTSFDPALARSLGLRTPLFHYGLMLLLSIVVVAAFEAVGAILVVAMLILPGATASLLAQRVPSILAWSSLHAVVSAVLGISLGVAFDVSLAASIVVVGAGLFGAVWIARGLGLRRAI